MKEDIVDELKAISEKESEIMNMKSHLGKKYLNGGTNKAIRYYFYMQRGLGLLNEFKYLFLIIFGIYIMLKLTNPFLLGLMVVASLPILIGFGWLQVHVMSKALDWLNIEFATFWSRYNFELQERQTKSLESIDKKIKGA